MRLNLVGELIIAGAGTKVFNRISGIGGFTILGSGEVALILDVPGLMGQVAVRSGGTAVEQTA